MTLILAIPSEGVWVKTARAVYGYMCDGRVVIEPEDQSRRFKMVPPIGGRLEILHADVLLSEWDRSNGL